MCGCDRTEGDIGLFLMEHEGENCYCFDCVKPRALFDKKSELVFRSEKHGRTIEIAV